MGFFFVWLFSFGIFLFGFGGSFFVCLAGWLV